MSEKFGAEESKDQLENGVEKPISFELDETEKMRLREMISEEAMLELDKRISKNMVDFYKDENLNSSEGTTVDRQCLERFGLNWAELRRQMLDNTINPIVFIKPTPTSPAKNDTDLILNPRDLLQAINTGHWMTRRFTETLKYIYASGEKYSSEELEWCIKDLNNLVEGEQKEEARKKDIEYWIPIITNLAMPEKIQKIFEINADVIGEKRPTQILSRHLKRRGF